MSLERTLTVRVERISRQTPEILAFELVHPWGRPLPAYEAGAHIDVHMPGGFSRQYSLARAPGMPGASDASRYVIGVKRETGSRGGSAKCSSTPKSHATPDGASSAATSANT